MAWCIAVGIMAKKTAARRPSARAGARKSMRNTTARPTARRVRAFELMVAGLAHDVRTPLTGILAAAELLSASDLGERERRWVAALASSAQHLEALTTLVVDAVKTKGHDLALRANPFDARALAQGAATSLAARAEAAGLACRVDLAADLPTQAIGDSVRLRAALENLIDNAVKFTRQGEVALKVGARRLSGGRVRLAFAVTDSGIGMTRGEMQRLFRPFAQASERVARRFGGAGLGLVLVKRLAKAMGGDLTAVSRRGAGSTFTFAAVVNTGLPRSA
jgi:two-component system, sensor histidine kinase